MLAGPNAAELLERLMANPEAFLENGELEEEDWQPMTPGQWTALGRDVKLLLAVVSLRISLAQQRTVLGSS